MIRVGYACINSKLPGPNRTCRLRNATPDTIITLASVNLAALERILAWNAAHKIELFRITSDVIPFGSHKINRVPWQRIFKAELKRVGTFIRDKRLRVSMHPGQFTVINSPREEVIDSSIRELAYHSQFLDALGIDDTHKIVIHLGGVYDDKELSIKRFISSWKRLNRRTQARVVIENDERCYSIADVLRVSDAVGGPVVFDVFHHGWNRALQNKSLRSIIQMSGATWRKRDGRTKIHYSNQWPGKPPGTHSKSISVKQFHAFYDEIRDLDIDVMLEVKDKEQSVLKLKKLYPV